MPGTQNDEPRVSAETTCHYCGDPLELYPPTKRRMELGIYHKFHAACTKNWDNEGKRTR